MFFLLNKVTRTQQGVNAERTRVLAVHQNLTTDAQTYCIVVRSTQTVVSPLSGTERQASQDYRSNAGGDQKASEGIAASLSARNKRLTVRGYVLLGQYTMINTPARATAPPMSQTCRLRQPANSQRTADSLKYQRGALLRYVVCVESCLSP
jgi:hypothetical protein